MVTISNCGFSFSTNSQAARSALTFDALYASGGGQSLPFSSKTLGLFVFQSFSVKVTTGLAEESRTEANDDVMTMRLTFLPFL